ncbi:hypothetical protein V7S43_017512 [Phytophthora oleae]|uniref:Uncharacterized protein n=1 Tax=Phytophthora oleae TaxID=2107226 RepID=A0ABD3EU20_9STRA
MIFPFDCHVGVNANNSGSQCAALETCYEGGATSSPCTVSTGGCPPCVVFADDACFLQFDGACPFGVDCSSFFSSSSISSSSSSAAINTTDTGASWLTSAASSASTSSQDTGSSAGGSVDADSSSGNTVLIVAILAVALGVAVLAVVLRKLFLRARAASEENQEEVSSPPGTVMTASFSSNGTSRDPGIMISRSAMGTDLSVTSKTSSAV